MKNKNNTSETVSRREFLKRSALGLFSIAGMALIGGSLFSSCEKESDEDALSNYERELEEEAKRKKQNT